MIALLSSLGDLPAEIAFCFATGNTARMRELDTGIIDVGMAADFVILDQAQHSPGADMLESIRQGNLPGIGMTIIDGKITSTRSRNTPPAGRLPAVVS
jgi:enamidase